MSVSLFTSERNCNKMSVFLVISPWIEKRMSFSLLVLSQSQYCPQNSLCYERLLLISIMAASPGKLDTKARLGEHAHRSAQNVINW